MNTTHNEIDSKLEVAEIIVESRSVNYNRVLDLTDPKVQEHLGITKTQISEILQPDSRAYELTQQIGDIAKQHSFDAIKAPSQYGHDTLIILPKD